MFLGFSLSCFRTPLFLVLHNIFLSTIYLCWVLYYYCTADLRLVIGKFFFLHLLTCSDLYGPHHTSVLCSGIGGLAFFALCWSRVTQHSYSIIIYYIMYSCAYYYCATCCYPWHHHLQEYYYKWCYKYYFTPLNWKFMTAVGSYHLLVYWY